jgi:hypothetical protein
MLSLGGYFLFVYIYFVRVSFGLRIGSSGGGRVDCKLYR